MMKKFFTIFAAVIIIISTGVMVQAQTILDRPEYRPSTDIYYDMATGQLLGSVYPILPEADQDFQLNILYQAPFSNNSIDQFNDNNGGGAGVNNFGDPESYWLEMSVGTASVEFANLDPGPCTTDILESADWTITGKWGDCHHTIMSGSMAGDKLTLSPRKYRSYDGEGSANENEPFDGGLLDIEIASYTVSDMGDGVGKLTVLICTDGDTDGYSREGGDCGLIDCNDSNGDINPGAIEIIGNEIDDDCNSETLDTVPCFIGTTAF